MGLSSWFKRFIMKLDVLIVKFQPHFEMAHVQYHKEVA
jgi:hypothetical protein